MCQAILKQVRPQYVIYVSLLDYWIDVTKIDA